MAIIRLSKTELENLLKVYEHFKDFSDYTMTLHEDQRVTVTIPISEVPALPIDREFKLKTYK